MKLMIFVLLSVVCGVYSKHVHPRNIMMQTEEELDLEEQPIPTDIDGMPIVSWPLCFVFFFVKSSLVLRVVSFIECSYSTFFQYSTKVII